MKKFIKLAKSDFLRVILTDVLPYELPFIYTNEGFYRKLKNNEISKSPFLYEKLLKKSERKPYEYSIKKDKNSDRKLYLIHPANQLEFVEIYRNYSHLITHLCSRSSFSLRSANAVASIYTEKSLAAPHEKFREEGVEAEVDKLSPQYASSFFSYKKYNFLYKFYDSYEFHRIEKKFHCLFTIDISKCFDSISTSMLMTSLRGEDEAKNAKKRFNFEQNFIQAMENTNNGRSHGIVIGPEFSRVFAEIILQTIDIEIKNDLSSIKIHEGIDYVIKRYVDDYFIFHNTPDVKTKVHHAIKSCLEKYKLYCNESKSKQYSAPIITPVTSAKIHIQEQLSELFNIFEINDNISDDIPPEGEPHNEISIIKSLNRYDLIANKYIRNIKCVISDAQVDFSGITGYFFTLIKIKAAELDNKYPKINDEKQEERLCRFLLIVLELSFFVYAMDLRVRSTYLLSQIIIIFRRLSKRLRPEKNERVTKKINDESNLIFQIFIKDKPSYNLEILNLIISLGVSTGNDFNEGRISKEKLAALIGVKDGQPGYFELMTGLYYIKTKKEYSSIKKNIVSTIEKKISSSSTNVFESSELTHIFLDSMACPYLSVRTKNNLLKLVLKDEKIDDEEVTELYNILSSGTWFIDWNKKSAIIERLLQKKELRTPYGD